MESGIACKSLTAYVTDMDRFVRFSGVAVFHCHYVYRMFTRSDVNSCGRAIRKIVASWNRSSRHGRMSTGTHPVSPGYSEIAERFIMRVQMCVSALILHDCGPQATFHRIRVQLAVVPEKSRNYGTTGHLLSISSAFIIFSLIHGGARMRYPIHFTQRISVPRISFQPHREVAGSAP